MLKEKGSMLIETERLILRPFNSSDAPDMYNNWTSDHEVTKYLSWQAHTEPVDTEGFLAYCLKAYDDPFCFRWAITLRNNGDHPVGMIDCVEVDKKISSCEIGYVLSKAYWGKGFMTEALTAVIHYLKDVGFLRICARHNTENPASGKVMLKAGMEFEGVLRKSDVNNMGVAIDVAWYSYINEGEDN